MDIAFLLAEIEQDANEEEEDYNMAMSGTLAIAYGISPIP
jgi:hypothetical protein